VRAYLSTTVDMLDAIHEYRRRTGRRAVGDGLADEFLRGTWDED